MVTTAAAYLIECSLSLLLSLTAPFIEGADCLIELTIVIQVSMLYGSCAIVPVF